MVPKKKVAVIAAHPDDEVLGCGGVIAWHVAQGNEVHVVIMADGVGARGGLDGDISHSELIERQYAAQAAFEVLGVASSSFLGFQDNKMDAVPLLHVTQKLECVITSLKPEIVYTHYAYDLNIDHRVTHQAAMTVCRPLPHSSVKEIYSFEVPSSTGWMSSVSTENFSPSCFVDITDYWERKLNALECYFDEMRPYPHARSYEGIESLARFRGSLMGISLAESFQVERLIL